MGGGDREGGAAVASECRGRGGGNVGRGEPQWRAVEGWLVGVAVGGDWGRDGWGGSGSSYYII